MSDEHSEDGEVFAPLNEKELDAIECEIIGDGGAAGADDGQQYSRAEPEKRRGFIGGDKCGKICGTISELIASRKGEKYKLSEDEREQLGNALDPVLEKYMPTDGNDISAELSLALVAVAIIAPRMGDA